MKKILLVILFCFLFMGIVSAGDTIINPTQVQVSPTAVFTPADNINSKYGTYDLTDDKGTSISSLKLINNTDICSGSCSSTITINLYDKASLVDGISFINVNTNKDISLDYVFQYSDRSELVYVPSYDIICSIDEKNSSEICSEVEGKGYYEYRDVWNDYKLGQILPAGTYKLKLQADLGIKPITIDWQIKSQNNWLNNWQIWQNDPSVLAYYPFDELSGNAINSVNGSFNGTLTNITQGITGIIGTAYNFTQPTSKVNISALPAASGNIFTINLWMLSMRKYINVTSDSGIHMLSDSLCRKGIDWRVSNIVFALGSCGLSEATFAYNQSVNYGAWTMYSVTYDGTNASFYVNGALIGINNSKTYNFNVTNMIYTIGRPSAAQSGNISIDEVSIWNKSLTAEDIQTLYNSGYGFSYPFYNLSINVISPQNTTYNTNSILVNFSASDDIAVSSQWFNNGSANITYSSPVTLNLSNGNYHFIFYANDSTNNIISQDVYFNVNYVTPPVPPTQLQQACQNANNGLTGGLNWTTILIVSFLAISTMIFLDKTFSSDETQSFNPEVISAGLASFDSKSIMKFIISIIIIAVVIIVGVSVNSTIGGC